MATAIFDGHYLLHRVLHVPQLRMLSTKDKKPTGGVFGLLKSLRSTVYDIPEVTRVVVVFDGAHSKRRVALYPDYKKRPPNDEVDSDGLSYREKFGMQLNYLKVLLPKMGVKVAILPDKEGDDVIGILARNLNDRLKIVSSDDRDMLQLVAEDVHIWRPLAGERVSLDNFEEKAGSSYKNWLLRKCVLGDDSDNIPGIKGVGKRTVDEVLSECDIGEYPHDAFFEAAMMRSGKRYQKIFEGISTVLLNFELIDIAREEFTDEEIEQLVSIAKAPAQFDVLFVKKFFQGFEFFSLIENFENWITKFQVLR